MSVKTPKKSRSSSRSSKPKRVRHKKRHISGALLLIIIAVLTAVTAAGGLMYSRMQAQTADTGIRKVEITYGMTVQEIAELLREEGVISSIWGFRFHLRRQGIDRSIQTGTFYIPADVSVSEVSEMITRSDREGQQSEVRIYPGFTIEQIADMFSSRIRGVDRDQFLEEIHRQAESRGYPFAEGFFFPGDYTVSRDEFSVDRAVSEAFDRFAAWEQAHRQDIARSPYTVEEIVITASMIQREAGSTEEMPMIAGIIWKRLEQDMPLGIDATTRYELDNWSTPILWEDLQRMTPYNTRRNTGLPPTGISNPGIQALHAALHPETSPYLYYLHDADGKIHYAETYAEHRSHIEGYLR